MRCFQKKTIFSVSEKRLQDWSDHPAFEQRLRSPWGRLEVVDAAHYLLRFGPFRKTLPWSYERQIDPITENTSRLCDKIHYQSHRFLSQEIRRLFRYRHRLIKSDLATLLPTSKKQRVLITGSTGLLGCTLVPFLSCAGHAVRVLVRDPKLVGPDHMPWDPKTGKILQAMLEGYDTIIHLSGAPIGFNLDDPLIRKTIHESHTTSTRFLVDTFQRLQSPPSHFFCASSCSYYGSKKRSSCTETATPGEGFLADVARETEAIAQTYTKGRTLLLRFGTILGGKGGILRKVSHKAAYGLLPIFGTGSQQISWISVDDAAYAIYHLMEQPKVRGPVNLCTPSPVTNRELVTTLTQLYGKTQRLRFPSWLLKAIWGSSAQEMLLADITMIPSALKKNGFSWQYPDLETVLKLQLGLLG